MQEAPPDSCEVPSHVRRRNIVALVLSWIVWSPFQAMAHPYSQLYERARGNSLHNLRYILALVGHRGPFEARGGYIADKYGRREVLWKATLLMACSYLLLALAPDWRALLVGHAISSLALFYQPALWSLMADSTVKETRGRVFAAAMFAPGLIITLAPALAVYLVSSLGLVTSMRLVYAGASIAGLVAALIRWRMVKETLPLGARRRLNILRAYQEAVGLWGGACLR